MRFTPTLAFLLCFAVTGAGAESTSSSIRIDSVSSSNTSISTNNSSSTGGDHDSNVLTTTTSSTSSDSVGGVTGTTSCSMNSRGQTCEITCQAPKVALCVQASAERRPRCSCR